MMKKYVTPELEVVMLEYGIGMAGVASTDDPTSGVGSLYNANYGESSAAAGAGEWSSDLSSLVNSAVGAAQSNGSEWVDNGDAPAESAPEVQLPAPLVPEGGVSDAPDLMVVDGIVPDLAPAADPAPEAPVADAGVPDWTDGGAAADAPASEFGAE